LIDLCNSEFGIRDGERGGESEREREK